MERTHASFFSGVGGLDLGLERAGWRTVSFSEIDPYACAVLGERRPRVPNLGSILGLSSQPGRGDNTVQPHAQGDGSHQPHGGIPVATLWTGGFPCQDLSVAGKRRGLAGARSGLAFAFLDLVERHRPPAIILENVPGLLSSHGGRDLGALAHRLGQLGYGWAYRVLDAQHFGVPQRRRRVFICALHLERGFGPDSAAEVLSVGSRCGRHPAAGVEAGPGAAEPARGGVDIARAVTGTSGKRHDEDTDTLVPAVRSNPYGDHISDEPRLVLGSPPDAGRVREADGLAGRLDDSPQLAPTLRVDPARSEDGGPGDTVPIIAATLNSGGNDGGFRTEPGEHLLIGTLREHVRPGSNTDHTVLAFNPYRTLERDGSVTSGYAPRSVVDALHGPTGNKEPLFVTDGPGDSPLLPLGLDSHRYRCCGNGVVADVSEWIGHRLAEVMR